jgi:putative oxidoreductase
MLKKLLTTNDSTALTITRIMLGLALFPHGAQKLLGWFGGYGFTGTMGFLTGVAHLPWIIAFLVIIIEFFGALLLVLGIGTRIVAMSVAILFVGIIITSHGHNGFFMNWDGTKAAEGYEYHLLVIGMALALLAGGAGKWSLDYLFQRKLSQAA